MFSHQKAYRLIVWALFCLVFSVGLATTTFAQQNIPYPNTTIRAATEAEKIEFRWHDLCRQRGLPLYNEKCLALHEQAKRDVQGSRYKPSNAGNGARAILWGFGAIDALGGRRNGSLPSSGRPPYTQEPPRRFVSTPPFAGNTGSYDTIFSRRASRRDNPYPRYERRGSSTRSTRISGGWGIAQDILGSVLSRRR